MRGTISAAKPSQSGKTLSLQIGGTWYSTKSFELQQHVGKEIVGETKDSEYNGKVIHWLESYTLVGEAAPAAPAKGPIAQPVQSSQYQPLISNLAAHLITAGKDPADLGPWFFRCKSLLEGKEQAGEDPNDPIPF